MEGGEVVIITIWLMINIAAVVGIYLYFQDIAITTSKKLTEENINLKERAYTAEKLLRNSIGEIARYYQAYSAISMALERLLESHHKEARTPSPGKATYVLDSDVASVDSSVSYAWFNYDKYKEELPYSIEELVRHLESKYLSPMDNEIQARQREWNRRYSSRH